MALTMVATGGAIVLVDAAPALATTCSWTTKYSQSNCDGVWPNTTSCANDAITARSRLLTGDFSDPDNPVVELRYSPSCRAVWGRIQRAWGTSGANWCTVTVQRTSDNKYYNQDVGEGASSAYTRMLYDAGTTSWAYATCAIYISGIGMQYVSGSTAVY